MTMNITKKFAIVTGASTGIGRATAIALAKEGAYIVLVARSEDKLVETKRMIDKAGGKSTASVADLSSLESINNLVRDIKAKTKQVDILVNIAGIWHGKDEVYANTDYEKFSQKVIMDTFMVGAIAPSLLAHAFIPLMPNGAKIVNLSGTFENGAKGWIPYFVSKRAIEDLTIGLSQELKNRSIQVNCISPSDTATEQYKKYFPEYIPEAVDPTVIANKIVSICKDDSEQNTGKVVVIKKDKTPFESFHH